MKLTAVLLGLFLAGPPSLVAAPPPEPPVFSSEVALVLLPVFVVGSDGRAVRGLGADDFEISADGKRVPVVSFRYVDTTSPEDQAAIREASAARRRFLLLFDKSFTTPAGLNRAQQAAADFVRSRLAPSDLAAVATFDLNRGVMLAANFTEDRGHLLRAIENLHVAHRARISDPLALAEQMVGLDARAGSRVQEGGQLDVGGLATVLVNQMRAAEVEAYRGHIEGLIAGMEHLARALRGVAGRKQVLYFSAGFDSRLLIGQTGEEQKTVAQSSLAGRLWEIDGATRFGDVRLREELTRMTRAFTAADAVIHTIDVTGLGSDDSLARTWVTVDPRRETGGRESLNLISSDTGGRFFRDANDLGPVLSEMLDMTSRFYVLGFQPAEAKGPGAYHKVRVRVARKGTTVSHRPGYYEQESIGAKAALLSRQFEAAELVMAGAADLPGNGLKVSGLCFPLPAREGRQSIALVLQVPASALEWSRGRTSSLELYSYAVAEDGTVQDYIAQFARIDSARRPVGEARGVSFQGRLRVPAGRYTLRTLVVERETGASGVQILDVNVPRVDPQGGFLLPPFLVEEASAWLNLSVARRDQDSDPSPFDVGDTQFVPRTSFEVRGGAPQRMVLVAFAPPRPGDAPGDVQIRSSLTAHDGQAAPAGMLRIEKVYRHEDGRRTFLLDYTPDAVAPGDYTLRIALGEGNERLEAYSLLRVRSGS
jgi:VWFA-related protein